MFKSTGKARRRGILSDSHDRQVRRNMYRRRLMCEALEDRRLLSVGSPQDGLYAASAATVAAGQTQPSTNQVGAASVNAEAAKNGYVVITTSAIQSHSTQLAAFVNHKRAQGFTVSVATESAWGGGTGYVAADRIHNWLATHYASMGLQYVLLIGNPSPGSGDVPMRNMYLRQCLEAGYAPYATDYYYSALTVNWDADGDNCLGEMWDDIPDMAPPEQQVMVGRIPVYNADYASLDKILAKTIVYQDSLNTDWRKSVLLPVAQISHGAGETPWDFSLGVEIKNEIATPNKFSAYTLYERQGTDAKKIPIVASDAALTRENLLNAWKNKGLVIVNAHSNSQGVYRKVWNDTGDGSPQSAEITSLPLLSSSDTSLLDDAHPSIVILNGCSTASPSSSTNLAYSLLKNGAVSVCAATAVTKYFNYPNFYDTLPYIYPYGYISPLVSKNYADTYAYSFYMAQSLVSDPSHESIAAALQSCRDWEYWENSVTMNVYGDPSTVLLPTGQTQSPPSITGVVVAEAGTVKNGKLESNEPLKITWAATSTEYRIASLLLYVDGKAVTAIKGPYSGLYYSCAIGTRAAGAHSYKIKVTDSRGLSATVSGTFTVVKPWIAPPSLLKAIVAEADAPKNGILESNERLKITWVATSVYGITSQTVKVDGKVVTPIKGPFTGGCYSCVIGVRSAGTHTFTIKTINAKGVSSTISGTFTVLAPVKQSVALASQ